MALTREGLQFEGKLFEGLLFGKKPLISAMERSGVVRLWMYDLYEQAIKEDEAKRQKVEQPVAPQKPHAPIKKTKTAPRTKAKVPREHPSPYRSTPYFAQVRPQAVLSEGIHEFLTQLPILNTEHLKNLPKSVVKTLVLPKQLCDKRRREEEELLLLAA